jgi:rSAM/selenodomain-associated transferase 1
MSRKDSTQDSLFAPMALAIPGAEAREAILVFVKHPQPGQVKTRLAAAMGATCAAVLYQAFVADVLGAVTACSAYEHRVCFTPATSEPAIRTWLGDRHRLMAQVGTDLGLRMTRAFEQTFSNGYDRLVLIGTDIPQIQPETLHAAFSALGQADTVIGPATDGGYYLIGFRKESFSPRVFQDIVWGSDGVLDATLSRLSSIGRRCILLPCLTDIDDIKDLTALDLSPGSAPHTAAAISRLCLDLNTTRPKGKMSLNVPGK